MGLIGSQTRLEGQSEPRHSRKRPAWEADAGMAEGASGADRGQLEEELARLRQEHRDLDVAIEALQRSSHDQLQLARLKKRKLALRDRIGQISDSLTPDIIA
jgi:hypothetical protein